MDFELSKEEYEFQENVYDFLRGAVTDELREEIESRQGWGPHIRKFMRQLGEKHWLAINWPEEYGGLGESYMHHFILREAIARFGGPDRPLGVSMAGPIILLYGSEEQKKEYLPRIARGEIEMALGYTESEAGSDLAALGIRAVEDGDYYIVNGEKLFNSACHYADYHWLGARTDPNATPKHRGISLFIVDMKSPGITIRPLIAMDGTRTNEVFYDNVKVPKNNLVGQKNLGWYQIAKALDFERVFDTADFERFFEELMTYVQDNEVSEQIRYKLADMATQIEVGRLLSWRLAWMINKGMVPNYEASECKIFISELGERLAEVGMEILGPYGQIKQGSRYEVLRGAVPTLYCNSRLRCVVGGTSEIQRNIIALRALALPR